MFFICLFKPFLEKSTIMIMHAWLIYSCFLFVCLLFISFDLLINNIFFSNLLRVTHTKWFGLNGPWGKPPSTDHIWFCQFAASLHQKVAMFGKVCSELSTTAHIILRLFCKYAADLLQICNYFFISLTSETTNIPRKIEDRKSCLKWQNLNPNTTASVIPIGKLLN